MPPSFHPCLRALLVLALPVAVWSGCPSQCSGHGTCDWHQCTCDSGFMLPDCSRRACPTGRAWADVANATDEAHAAFTECSNRGHCDYGTGICSCADEFFGDACQYLRCPRDRLNEECSNRGRCMSMARAAVEVDGRRLTTSTTYGLWDADKMFGCICDEGFTGYDCSLRECPTGDDPWTTSQAAEEQQVSCTCPGTCGGSFTLTFEGQTTAPLGYDADAAAITSAIEALTYDATRGAPNLDVTVALVGGTAVCDADGAAATITFANRPGALGLMTGDGSLLTTSSGSVTFGVSRTTPGTRENVECSGRGKCDTSTGLCTCDATTSGSFGPDNQADAVGAGRHNACGNPPVNIATAISSNLGCPTAKAGEVCSSHGACDSSSLACYCFEGYRGHDCSQFRCPLGRAWFDEATATDTAHADDVECSGRGLCERSTGLCHCQAAFEGAACQKLKATCLGFNGLARTMAQLSEDARINGVATSITYGVSDAPKTWDADMIQGCRCDRSPLTSNAIVGGFAEEISYDCGRTKCMTGDDPLTESQADEVQYVTCTGASGSFTLTFRDATTNSLSFDATAAQVKAELDALVTIGSVTVALEKADTTTSTAACDANGVKIKVTFTTEHGDLPAMTASGVTVTMAASVEFTKGTKEDAVCSNRGECNFLTGECKCYPGFASSDGAGNMGGRNDCGYSLTGGDAAPIAPIS